MQPPVWIIASEGMTAIRGLVARIAPSTLSVLVLGETGVGKEVIASAIHAASPRRDAPLVRFNCAALNEALLESELFGHRRGAFTGAAGDKVGLLESADGGTVLLDEVGEMSLATQAKLLRALEAKEILPVGGVRPRPIDVRFVSATNRNLRDEVKQGRFREDLYFRLAGVSLYVPPLRERVPEIPLLARHFLERAAEAQGRAPPELTPAALSALAAHAWPGNVRELRAVMERALLLCSADEIAPEHLLLDGDGSAIETTEAGRVLSWIGARQDPGASERQQIIQALQSCAGNQSRAAALLGMPRRTFVKKLIRYQVPRPRGDSASDGASRPRPRLRLV